MSGALRPPLQQSSTILLVEDDPGDQELTRYAFQDEHVRSDLRIVSDGREALAYLLREASFEDVRKSPRPDLVLLDYNMPGLNGLDVLERIRAHATIRCLPVVMFTTSSNEQHVLDAYRLGVNSYILKPLDMDRFVDVIKTLESYWLHTTTLPPS